MTVIPASLRGGAFGTSMDGDGRKDEGDRHRMSERLGIPAAWAWARQVHGTRVREVFAPGEQGEADALFTRSATLVLAVATADCFPVIVEGDDGVGIAHAGWRGAAAGVVGELVSSMQEAGIRPRRAAVGPGIGPCCFEVGPEVAGQFGGFGSTTTWGTQAVDLVAALAGHLDGLAVEVIGVCTRTDDRFHSHRRDGTTRRQVSLAWLPG
jgi:polyphenol oxidase